MTGDHLRGRCAHGSPPLQERVLDLGCGSGDLTLQALVPAVQPNGAIVGYDASPDLLAKARANAAASSLPASAKDSLTWVERDGHDLDTYGEAGSFDAVFSNAALHWMKRDPAKVVRGVHRCLKPGGRYVGEVSAVRPLCAAYGTLTDAYPLQDGRRHEHDRSEVDAAYGASRTRRRRGEHRSVALSDTRTVQQGPRIGRFPSRELWYDPVLQGAACTSTPADLGPGPRAIQNSSHAQHPYPTRALTAGSTRSRSRF